MPRNVEIKAKVLDLEFMVNKAKSLSCSEGQVIVQRDVFFSVSNGRLKLRHYELTFYSSTDEKGIVRLRGGDAELIFYDRSDGDGPKLSEYKKCNVPNGSQLEAVLKDALGSKGVVSKTRQLFMVGQTRIHIDTVEGLGSFMELEVMLLEDQLVGDGQEIAYSLMSKLGVNKEDLIAGAYMDLILKK